MVGSHQKLQNHDLNVTIDGRPLSHVSSFRYLGLYIDENSTWTTVMWCGHLPLPHILSDLRDRDSMQDFSIYTLPPVVQ